MRVRTKFPLRGLSSPGWLPSLLNYMDNIPAPHLTLSMWANPDCLECINEELKSQSITLTVTYISTKQATCRKTHLNDGLHFSLSSWTLFSMSHREGPSGFAKQQSMLLLICSALRGVAETVSGRKGAFYGVPWPFQPANHSSNVALATPTQQGLMATC